MTRLLELNNIFKCYGDQASVKNLTLALEKGNIGCLLGPSGCGKTTALRTIAGFETPTAGEIILNGAVVSSRNRQVPPEKRRIGMVFQDYALFPHLNVSENVAFGLHHLPKRGRADRVSEMLELVGLQDAAGKYPHELSGGQQQRVALARALAPKPQLLLMDEPFSNLDVTLRERLSAEVREILKAYQATALMVTHNQNEAFAMADEIGVMHDGALLQWDSAHNLYHRPASKLVADFVGEGVLLSGRVIDYQRVATGLGTLQGDFTYPCRSGCPAWVLIRPEDVVHDDASDFRAKVLKKNFRGANILYTLQLPTNETVLALVPSHHQHALGQLIGITPQVDDIILFEGSFPNSELPMLADWITSEF